MTMAIWGYVRGDAIGEQQVRIKAYAIGENMKLDRVVIEQRGVRAYTPVADRPIGGPLFEKLVKGDIVIVALLDRLFCRGRAQSRRRFGEPWRGTTHP
jgi:hypothetical protein